MTNPKGSEVQLYDLSEIKKRLPPGYRLRTRFADLDSPMEIVFGRMDDTFIQHKESKQIRIFGIFPWTMRRWVTIGEAAPSMLGLTALPVVAITQKYRKHVKVLANALKDTPFRVEMAGI